MFTSLRGLAASTLLASAALAAAPAFAQDAVDPPSDLTVGGSVALVSDYRFRGVSQTDEEMAIQGGITVSHASGAYAGTWASNLSGWGTFGGANMELDLFAGYAMPLGDSGATLDVGLTWYMYPGGFDDTDFAEPYVKLSGDYGPVSALIGVAYAPEQGALANVSNHPDSDGESEDNLYLWTDLSTAIPNTPLTAKAHAGYSNGNPGLGPNGTSLAPTGEYLDWMLGLDAAVGPLTLGVAYVDTNLQYEDYEYLLPNFSSTKDGSNIAGAQVVFSVSAGF